MPQSSRNISLPHSNRVIFFPISFRPPRNVTLIEGLRTFSVPAWSRGKPSFPFSLSAAFAAACVVLLFRLCFFLFLAGGLWLFFFSLARAWPHPLLSRPWISSSAAVLSSAGIPSGRSPFQTACSAPPLSGMGIEPLAEDRAWSACLPIWFLAGCRLIPRWASPPPALFFFHLNSQNNLH